MSYITSSPQIPKKVVIKVTRELEFICRQLLRFAKMPAKELIAYLRKHPEESFCTIPRPDGKGHYHCGALAWKKFGVLVDCVFELAPSLAKRVERARTKDTIVSAFICRVLKEGRVVDQETSELVLLDILEVLRQSLVVTEHYLPCVLFLHGGPKVFSIGPVTFSRRVKFFQDKKQAFKRSVVKEMEAHIEHVNSAVARGFHRERAATEADSKRFIRGLQARAIKTYRAYPWIASVKVTDCDEEISKERAARIVEMALHTIRVILGARHTKKLRLAWSRSDALRTAHMWTDARDVIRVSIGSSSIGPVGAENWHDAMMQSKNELVVFGSSLAPLVDPIEVSHLHERFIDSINWFGDAATDPVPTSSIVKYVSSIERLLFGKVAREHKKTFANRVRLILDVFGCDDDHNTYEMALKVYDARSALLHGAYSPRDETVQLVVHHAEELSRMCLLCATQLYPMMLRAFANPDPGTLEEIMKRIADNGLNWLAEYSPE
jgi:hypothetical protein